jgi:transcriptional regulator with XRE-family HTH domain
MDRRELVKQALARRIRECLAERNMSQSDLARAAEIPRELVSSYANRRSFPNEKSFHAIAKALGFRDRYHMVPELEGVAVHDEGSPAMDIQQSPGHPGRAWLRINQSCSMATAIKIATLLEQDGAAQRAKE